MQGNNAARSADSCTAAKIANEFCHFAGGACALLPGKGAHRNILRDDEQTNLDV
jgi:hypothetical protein